MNPLHHLTTAQAAEKLGVKPIAVRQAILRKRLKATKHGRDWLIAPADLETYRTETRK